MDFEFVASCGRGLEKLVAAELRQLGVDRVRPLAGSVVFFGSLAQALSACLWLRTASRIMLVLARVNAADSDELYQSISQIDWSEHLAEGGSFAISAHGTNEQLRDSRFVAMRVKDAIVDQLRDAAGERPDVQRERPDVLINVNLRGEKATLAIDLSGEALHRRGYRVASPAIVAPLRETLAAALLLCGGWGEPGAGGAGGGLLTPAFVLDPMCGSGTIAIEAACMAADIAPGLLREYWGFTDWRGHDPKLWQELRSTAQARAAAGLKARRDLSYPPVLASDNDASAIQVARASALKAGVADLIEFRLSDLADYWVPPKYHSLAGLVATNPPYAQRLFSLPQLPALYSALGHLSRVHPAGCSVAVISPDERLGDYLNYFQQSRPAALIQTFNGGTATEIAAWRKSSAAAGGGAGGGAGGSITPTLSSESVDAFVNRFTKMVRQRARWARRNNIENYRIYDADLPDFNLAIDYYQGARGTSDEGDGWLVVAEYRAPSGVDAELALARLAEALVFIPKIVGTGTQAVFLKRRERAKGGSQYSQVVEAGAVSAGGATQSESQAVHRIMEGGLLFEVDLASRLDTGIFTDHRITRALLREKAGQRDCLNLFAYTGSASVYMADGQARSVTSVDLSNTYLQWAGRNMELNGFVGDRLIMEQADVLTWLKAKRAERVTGGATPHRYGLVFVDVPTFSNSRRMGRRSFDVLRDHVQLLIDVTRILTEDGEAVFSTNLRSFKPDSEALARAGVEISDISSQTIDEDYRRNSKIHHCYLVRRSKGENHAIPS